LENFQLFSPFLEKLVVVNGGLEVGKTVNELYIVYRTTFIRLINSGELIVESTIAHFLRNSSAQGVVPFYNLSHLLKEDNIFFIDLGLLLLP
jgi:hypothetical protein